MCTYEGYSVSPGWSGCLPFGEVSNDTIHWRPVGNEHPVHSVLRNKIDEGFEVICFDKVFRYFVYFRFRYKQIENLTTNDKYHLKRVYY